MTAARWLRQRFGRPAHLIQVAEAEDDDTMSTSRVAVTVYPVHAQVIHARTADAPFVSSAESRVLIATTDLPPDIQATRLAWRLELPAQPQTLQLAADQQASAGRAVVNVIETGGNLQMELEP